jgi:hypothetical protein
MIGRKWSASEALCCRSRSEAALLLVSEAALLLVSEAALLLVSEAALCVEERPFCV